MKYLLLLSLAFFAGCAAPYRMATRSGKPEVVVGVEKKALISALVNSLMGDGYIIEQQTENVVSGTRTDIDIWWGAHQRHVKQYAITDDKDSVRVILHHLVNGSSVAKQQTMEDDQYVLNTLKRSLQ